MGALLSFLARPERFELPTAWFVARYSIQLSYGRIVWPADARPAGAHILLTSVPQVKAFSGHNWPMRSSFGLSFRGLWLVLTICTSGCASVFDVDGALAVIPYQINDSGRIIVRAQINEAGSFDFAIDTGASISVLIESAVERADLEYRTDDSILIHGMVGSGRYATATIDSLTVGSEVWADARVAVLPGDTPASTGLDGILGVDFLSRYALGYSSRDRIIRLYPPSLVAERTYKGWSSIRMERLDTKQATGALYTIDIEISGRTIPALLDLGSGANLMNGRALRFIGERLRKRSRESELAGAVEATTVHAELRVRRVKTGNMQWRNKNFLIVDIHVMDILQLDHRPVAIIGSDFFNRRDFVIDFARNRLLVRTTD